MIVLAPTGVAAINARGVTIHSFFQLPFGPQIFVTTNNNNADNTSKVKSTGNKFYHFNREKFNTIRSLDMIVIDEISMVKADLLDGVDAVLRRYRDRNKPFAFAHGQVYVALSRCRSFQGLVLTSPLSPRTLINDASVQVLIVKSFTNINN